MGKCNCMLSILQSLFYFNFSHRDNSSVRMSITRRLPLVVIFSFQKIGSKWLADTELLRLMFRTLTHSARQLEHLLAIGRYLASCRLLISMARAIISLPPTIHSHQQTLSHIIKGWCRNGDFLELHHKHLPTTLHRSRLRLLRQKPCEKFKHGVRNINLVMKNPLDYPSLDFASGRAMNCLTLTIQYGSGQEFLLWQKCES